jgi:hypothetical protein
MSDNYIDIRLTVDQHTNLLHTLNRAAKHMRRLQMVYVKCHEKCLCDGVCENPDLLLASEIVDELKKLSKEIPK